MCINLVCRLRKYTAWLDSIDVQGMPPVANVTEAEANTILSKADATRDIQYTLAFRSMVETLKMIPIVQSFEKNSSYLGTCWSTQTRLGRRLHILPPFVTTRGMACNIFCQIFSLAWNTTRSKPFKALRCRLCVLCVAVSLYKPVYQICSPYFSPCDVLWTSLLNLSIHVVPFQIDGPC